MILQFGCDAVLHYTFGLRGCERVSPKSIIYIYIYICILGWEKDQYTSLGVTTARITAWLLLLTRAKGYEYTNL